MSTEDTKPAPYEFSPYVLEEKTGIRISPEQLPEHRWDGVSAEIEAAFELLYQEPPETEFYKAIALLVFHARHLRPDEHSKIATLIQNPYKRRAGQPENLALKNAAEEYVRHREKGWFGHHYPRRQIVIAELAKNFKTSLEIARRAVSAAEKLMKQDANGAPL